VELRCPLHGDADGRELARLRALAGGDARIAFLPALTGAEVPRVLAEWDLLCCPSVCHEGGPTVAIEAQAVGTPVIGSRIGGLAELIADGENGRLVPPGDVPALATALREVALAPRLVDVWRTRLEPARTADDVARDYLALYAA
jgi:glycosyltransferase involved in cell wall biosynthesis